MGSSSVRMGVVIPAAGKGRRLGGRRKPFLELDGEPVLRWALRPFLEDRRTVAVVVALPPDLALEPPPWLTGMDRRIAVVPGGTERTDSVRAALARLPSDVDVIAVHDAARPLVTLETVAACADLAATGVGAVAGRRVVDSMKVAGPDGRVVDEADRDRLWHAHTPQCFPADLLRTAYRAAGLAGDDATMVSRAGGTVVMVRDDSPNLKITQPGDLALVEALLGERRATGNPTASVGSPAPTSLPKPVLGARIDLVADPTADLGAAVSCLRRSGIVAYPTETVYGLGSTVTAGGVRALQKVKRRASANPFIVLVPSVRELRTLAWTPVAELLAARFWPGPLTMILPDPERTFPEGILSDEGGVAVRVSPDPVVARLLDELGSPITSTSANAPGGQPAESANEAANVLDLLATADFVVLDGGVRRSSMPSTLVSCLHGEPRVLREGVITLSEIDRALAETNHVLR